MRRVSLPEPIHEINVGERKVQQLTLEGALARHLVPDNRLCVVVRKDIPSGIHIGGPNTLFYLMSNEIPATAVAYVVGFIYHELSRVNDQALDYYIPVQFYRHAP